MNFTLNTEENWLPWFVSWVTPLKEICAAGSVYGKHQNAPFEPEVKRQAVMAFCTRHVPAREIARNIGISRTVLYKWKDEIIGDEAYQSMRKHEKPSLTEERDALREEVYRLNQIRRQQMELDILKKAEEIIKKDPGISVSALTNREKTQIADVLRGSYPLTELLRVLELARSSFFLPPDSSALGR